MRLWITGSDGLLGSSLRATSAIGPSSMAFPLLATGRSLADIGDLSSLRSFAKNNPGITHIVNCAAFSLVDLAETRREEAFQANVIGTENLGILSKEIGARLVHISTDYVFQGDVRHPLKEDDPVLPSSYYGLTKLEGERRLQKVFPDACIIRTSWIFGRGGKNFVAKMLQMLQDQEEIRLTNDHWGRPTYVFDLSCAILQMLDKSGVFHFANAGEANKYEFGLAMRDIAQASGVKIATQRIVAVPSSEFPSPARRPAYSVFDTSKIEQEMKVQIRSWRDALREFLSVS